MNAKIATPRERPILMCAPMVVATLERRKTNTRRVVQFNAAGRIQERGGQRRQWHRDDPNAVLGCSYGQVGSTLYVRETFALECCAEIGWYDPPHNDGRPLKITESDDGRYWTQPHYRATDPAPELIVTDKNGDEQPGVRWTPSIYMPRWASRITLAITSIRVERLQDITEDDARAEGIARDADRWWLGPPDVEHPAGVAMGTARAAFERWWHHINGNRPGCAWSDNPYVWAIGFEMIGGGA